MGCLNCPSFIYGISIFIAGNVVTNYDLTLAFSVTTNPTQFGFRVGDGNWTEFAPYNS